MNLKQLIDEVNKDIDDQLNNADIIGWLNRAIDDLSPYARAQKKVTISLVPNTSEYTLPSDFISVIRLDNYRQIPLSDTTSTGYQLFGDKVFIQPVPSEAKNIDLFYEGTLPYLVNTDDIPAIPTPFHDLLVLFAVAKFKYQDEEENAQSIAWNEYLSRKEEFKRYMRQNDVMTLDVVYW